MASNYFEGALTSLLKPQEKSRLLKILAEIRKGVEGPNRKKNINKLCEKGCLKSVITNLQQPHLDILNVTLSILGNCCMEQACARAAVRQYNLLSYLNHTLEHYKEDSIQGRIFRIIGNMCQHWDRLANTVVEKESELEIVAKIVTFLKTVAEVDESADTKNIASGATICMAIRALKELANSNTVVTLITDCGVLKAIGMILIRFTPEWQSNKQHADILQAVLKLLYMYSKYNTNYDAIAELRNNDKGNAMDHFGKLVLLSPFIVVKIIVNLKKVCKLKSDLPVGGISQSLIERLQNPTYFPLGRADPMHRDYLKCLCLLIQQLLPLKAEILATGVIPTLLLILEDYTEFSDIALKNSILIIATLRHIFEDRSLIIMLKHGIINILSEKLNWLLGPDSVVDLSHKDTSEEYGRGHRKRCRREAEARHWCMKGAFEDYRTMKINCSQSRRMKQRSLSPSSENSLSSGPSYSPPSSPTLSLSDTEISVPAMDLDSDSDDYSPVCSDAEDEPSVRLIIIKEGDEDPSKDDEMDGQSSFTKVEASKSKPAFYSKKLLSHEIVKLIKLFINIRPVAMELNNGHLLTKLLMLLAPVNSIICPFDTFKVILTIAKTSEYLLGLMQTCFVRVAYKFIIWQHGFDCATCLHLQKLGQTILMHFSKLVEFGCGEGDIAHQLYRASLPVKEKLVTAIPFITSNKLTLRKLMIECCGLQILMQLFRNQSNLELNSAYYSLCTMAYKIGIKNPTMMSREKARQGTQLVIDIENYKPEANCAKIVCFKLDDGSCVQADRDFLSQKSDYFNRLLSGTFKESCEEEIRLCKVLNKSLKCLLLLLQYDLCSTKIYQMNVELEVLLDVISLTDRYLMEDLCSCVTMSVQYCEFLPTTIPIIYQWALESSTNILRVESVAYALVVGIDELTRLTMFQNLLQLGYTEQLCNDIEELIGRFIL